MTPKRLANKVTHIKHMLSNVGVSLEELARHRDRCDLDAEAKWDRWWAVFYDLWAAMCELTARLRADAGMDQQAEDDYTSEYSTSETPPDTDDESTE